MFLQSLPKGYQWVDLVADTYKAVPIKNWERQERGGTAARLMIIHLCQRFHVILQNFKNGENKTRLIELICQVIESQPEKTLNLFRCNKLFFSKENVCRFIDSNGIQEIAPKPSLVMIIYLHFLRKVKQFAGNICKT